MTDDVHNNLLKFLGYHILVLGMTGNTLSLVVLCRKPLRNSKIGPYLIALCIADIFALLTGVVYEMIKLYHSNLENQSLSLCMITFFFVVLSAECPSWLTVIITVERMICICRPLASIQRTHNPLTVVFTMVVILTALAVGFATLFVMSDGLCTPIWKKQNWLLSVTYSYIPSLVLIVCNSVIIYKMYKRPTLGQTPRSGPDSGNTIRVVMAINIVFLLTTLPVSVLLNNGKRVCGNDIILADFISSLNNAVNFLLYILFSRVFRQELKSLFRPKQQPQIYALSYHENL